MLRRNVVLYVTIICFSMKKLFESPDIHTFPFLAVSADRKASRATKDEMSMLSVRKIPVNTCPAWSKSHYMNCRREEPTIEAYPNPKKQILGPAEQGVL